MTDDASKSLTALGDLCTPWCVRVAATLRIAEHLADGVQDIEGLAVATGGDRRALHEVLRHLVGKGVFEEPSPGVFALNEVGRELLDPKHGLYLDLSGVGGRFAEAWGTLLTYARTGRSGYQDRFGLPFWEDLDAHPELGVSFDELMGPAGHGTPDTDFRISGGWESIRTLVDVGGGTGAMLAELLRAHPHLEGTLLDLPRTVARATNLFRAAGVEDRATAVGQSFFDPLPEGADLYLLRKVLNDWPEPEAGQILRRCAEACRPSSRVVVMGGVVPDERAGALTIEVVLLGGRHRSLDQFTELAEESGLQISHAGRQPVGFVVELRPVELDPETIEG